MKEIKLKAVAVEIDGMIHHELVDIYTGAVLRGVVNQSIDSGINAPTKILLECLLYDNNGQSYCANDACRSGQ